MTIQIATTLFHLPWCLLLISHFEMGVFGAALALNITLVTNFLVQELYLWVRHEHFAHLKAPFFVRETFQEWTTFLALGIPGTALQCFEWWAFEVLAIFAGYMSNADLAA